MDTVIGSLIGEFEECSSSYEVWEIFLGFITTRGFKCATYAYNYAPINEQEREDKGKKSHVRFALAGNTWITSMPKEGVEEYRAQRYEKIDPMVQHVGRRSMQPLYMARCLLSPDDPAFRSQDFVLSRAEHYGIFSAVGFPLMHPMGRGHGQITLHCAEPYPVLESIMETRGNEVHLASLYMHNFFQPHERKERARTYGVKGRPLEVLQLLNAGFTNNQIAEKLNVTAPTVSFHIKELRETLRVTSTREILPVALRLGIFDD